MENHAKIIFHIDMNAFFCSVASILDPTLRGKAFAIGRPNTYKGVLSTASYEARKFGIHSAMPQIEALRIKPDLKIVHIDYSYYEDYHNKFVDLVKQYTNLVEVASIDEVYADMTEISKTKHPLVLAKEIQYRLLNEYRLPCSIGIAPTLFLAKMASDIKKPLGIVVIRKREVEKILYDLGVEDIFGIGKKTYAKLISNDILKIKDFMNLDNKEKIIRLIGENTYNYGYSHILGNSSNEVKPDRYAISQSIGHSTTFDTPLYTFDEIALALRELLKSTYKEMIYGKYVTKTICITLRDTNFNTITRRKSIDDYSEDFEELYYNVVDLLEENYDSSKAYRLVGASLMNLVKKSELSKEYNIFTIDDKVEKDIAVNNLITEFKKKYGDDFINKGVKNDK